MLRAVFHEEDDARAVAARLGRDGFDVEVEVERFAGEDDDEDHPWAVVTDAPEFVLEVLVDEHDGWLDLGDAADPGADDPGAPSVRSLLGLDEPGESGAPVELPDAPRRIKGHFRRDED